MNAETLSTELRRPAELESWPLPEVCANMELLDDISSQWAASRDLPAFLSSGGGGFRNGAGEGDGNVARSSRVSRYGITFTNSLSGRPDIAPSAVSS